MYGITVHEDIIAHVILSNIEDAAKDEWGSKFCTAMYTIHRQYMYGDVHEVRSAVTVLTELTTIDQICNMHDAPTPNNIGPHSLAHAVDLNLSYFNALMNTEMDNEITTYGDEYASTSDSKSSAEKLHC